MKKQIPIVLVTVLGWSLCSAEAVNPKGRRLRDIVKAKFANQYVFIGGTTGLKALGTPEGDLLNREFSYITPENDFKHHGVHPKPGRWLWDAADAWIESAKKNGQLIRIHGPISPQCSKWAKEDDRSAEELAESMEDYMTALCKRYNNSPEVVWLDVVNETIDVKTGWFGPKLGTDAWENPWTQIGFETDIPDRYPILQEYGVPLYIIRAFEIANEHAFNLELVINQHGRLDERVIAQMKELVNYLRGRGLRVDALGWQAHIWRNWKDWASQDAERVALLESYIDWAHANGLGFHITEADIYVKDDEVVDEREVAAAYGCILKTLLGKRRSGEIGWNVWTLVDQAHYKKNGKQILGLWDKDYKPKRAYYEIQRVLEQAR